MRSPNKSLLAGLSCAAAFAFPLPAASQDVGAYLGGSFGQAKLKEFCSGGPVAACEDSDTGWKILGGFRFHRHFAAEATYIDWGKVFVSTPAVSATVKSSSFGIAAVGILPFERFSLFGKFGFLQTEQDFARVGAPSRSGDDIEAHYGIGLKFDLPRNWRLRAEWEQTKDIKAQMLSIGAEYRF